MKITKALSIKQPWAWLILNHYKDIEVRAWNTNFRGFFAIHTSKIFDYMGFEYLRTHVFKNMPLKHLYIRGKILGVARLHSIIEFKDYHHFFQYKDRHKNNPSWFDGRQKGFILQDIKPLLTPIEYKGRLNFFKIDEDLVEVEVENGVAEA